LRFKVFGRHTGLRISELIFGAGALGTRWGHGAEPAVARRLIDRYADAGGNVIDTSDSYQFGESEELLGEFLKEQRNRFVVATKFTQAVEKAPDILAVGNNRRAMILSVEASLRRLQTDRIDLYWAHFPDGVTPAEEIVRGFDDLVRAGKIVYAGLSNFPAWRVARAATIAELRGAAPIAGVQVEHSLVERTTEADLFPMAEALGLGVAAYSPLGGGMLTGKYRRGESGRLQALGGRVFQSENTPQRTAVLDELEAVARETGASTSRIAIAWVASRGAVPIIGPRTVEQLEDNLGAAGLKLAPEVIARLDQVSAVAPGYPHRFPPGGRAQLLDRAGKPIEIDRPAVAVA
jgi:aryl-alcohol dehydrogenase-like predicted oxidoreductase